MAPFTRHRRYHVAGNVAFQCLAFVVIIFATATWAYFHFVDPAALEDPERLVTVVPDYGPETMNLYRRSMISEALGRLNTVARMNDELIARVRGGPLDREQFRTLHDPLYQKMKDTASQLRSRGCPKKHEEAHRAAAHALGQHYQAMLHLEAAALTGDAAERERELRAASQALRQAKELQQKSRAAFGTY